MTLKEKQWSDRQNNWGLSLRETHLLAETWMEGDVVKMYKIESQVVRLHHIAKASRVRSLLGCSLQVKFLLPQNHCPKGNGHFHKLTDSSFHPAGRGRRWDSQGG